MKGECAVTPEFVADVNRVLDCLAASMDWGSGFLEDEDIEAWNRVGEVVGYPEVAVKQKGFRGYFCLEKRAGGSDRAGSGV